MKNKILACLAICILTISVGIAVAQQNSGRDAQASEMQGEIVGDASFATEVSEMKDPNSWDSEMRSLGLPPLEEIQKRVEREREIHWLDSADIEVGYWHGWRQHDYPEGDMFLWAYHFAGSAPHIFSGEIIDYGEHDDHYIAVWFELPSWKFNYTILEPGQSSVTTGNCTLDSDDQIVLLWQYEHTQETTDWDWMVKTAHWESAPPVTEYWAVIVGVENYTYIEDCAYGDDDAYDLYNRLLSYPNWDADHIKLLVDHNATKWNVKAAIDWMKANADEDDVCLFHFSGHGTYAPDRPPYDEADGYDEYLCTDDPAFWFLFFIRDDELEEWLTPIKAKKVVMLDSCWTGGFIKEAGVSVRTMPGVPYTRITDSFARDLDKPDYVVLTSSDDNETSYAFGPPFENGIFTYCVDEGLAGHANVDGDTDISAEELYAYVGPEVAGYTSGEQNPQIYDGIPGEVPIVEW